MTLEMFQIGLSIAEIAENARTFDKHIETHLISFIPTGEIKLEELVAPRKNRNYQKRADRILPTGHRARQRIPGRRLQLRRNSRGDC